MRPDAETRRSAFAVLGLDETASRHDVSTAYRRLALQHHPDLGGDPEVMSRINAAMEVLLDRSESAPAVASPSVESAPASTEQPFSLVQALLAFVIVPAVLIAAAMYLIVQIA